MTEHYHTTDGNGVFIDEFAPPYCGYTSFQAVLHGNNGWFLMGLGYYTLQTGDRHFVPQLEALADYFSIPNT